MGAGHPSKRVRDLARQLEVAIANTLTQSKWLVSDILRNRDTSGARDTANKDHAEATRLLDQLEEAIQRA